MVPTNSDNRGWTVQCVLLYSWSLLCLYSPRYFSGTQRARKDSKDDDASGISKSGTYMMDLLLSSIPRLPYCTVIHFLSGVQIERNNGSRRNDASKSSEPGTGGFIFLPFFVPSIYSKAG